MLFAAMFPGQGSQCVGMFSGLKEFTDTKQLLLDSSKILAYNMDVLVESGPAEALNSTERAQPALLAAGVAAWRAWQRQGGPKPAYMAGHSLGEYTALVCASALDFSTAVKLVEFRGQAMQEAVPAGAGAMAAVLGLDDAAVRRACSDASQGEIVAAANFNAPGQVVISGQAAAVVRATELCKQAGAKRVIPLPVSVPSHCDLMRPAAIKLAKQLNNIEFNAPLIPVIHNVDVAEHIQPGEIRQLLIEQLYSPVRWVETVETLARRGVTRLIEFGPGRVLTGLVKRIDKSLAAYPVYDRATLEAALAAVKAP